MAEAPSGSGIQPPGQSPDTPSGMPANGRAVGLREALVVGGLTVVVVLLAGVATYLLPGAREVVLGTPLLIVVLIGGTAAVLWSISRPRR